MFFVSGANFFLIVASLVSMILLYILSLLFLSSLITFYSTLISFGVGISLVLCVDACSCHFLFTLFFISRCVLTWSYFYLDLELTFRTFCGLVLCFLFSISGLVLSGSLITAFVFWDLLGFTSFFLVIYPRGRSALSGGLLTGISNRCGDMFLVLFFGSTSLWTSSSLSLCTLLLVAASFTKSAQAPFSAWLPSAIVAPTPVRALVHSSTLVTAGVFLVFRFCSPRFPILIYVGAFTSFVAGLAACFEVAIKKVVALSTLSQLGLIFAALGLGERSLAFLHLNLHAALKALLFLAVGTLCHLNYGSQVVSLSVNAFVSSGLVGVSFVISCASLCGLFFLSGWVSKESILCKVSNRNISRAICLLLWLTMILTIAYSCRLLAPAFRGINNFLVVTHTVSLSLAHTLPLLLLCFLSCVEGWRFSFGGPGPSFVLPSLFSLGSFINLVLLVGLGLNFYYFVVPVFSPWV